MNFFTILLEIGPIISLLGDVVKVVQDVGSGNKVATSTDVETLVTSLGSVLVALGVPGMTSAEVQSVITELVSAIGGSSGNAS